MGIKKVTWGEFKNKKVFIYSIKEGSTVLKLSNYGALMQSLIVLDKSKQNIDILLGYDHLVSYINDSSYMGVVPAVFANRISRGKLLLNGKEVELDRKGAKHALHAGAIGKEVWEATVHESANGTGVIFTLRVQDGYDGFPGDIRLKVTYFLDKNGFVYTAYEAESSKDTVINLTNHAYFNLGEKDILSHMLRIYSDSILETDIELIPTGKTRNIKNSAFDFTKYKKVGQSIDEDDQQLIYGKGYDINYITNRIHKNVVNHPISQEEIIIYPVADMRSNKSGIELKLLSSQPGVQLYTANQMSSESGKKNVKHFSRAGLCLETQHYPDSPNHVKFPSTTLKKGMKYFEMSVYKLSVDHIAHLF